MSERVLGADCKLVIFHSPQRGRGRLLHRQARACARAGHRKDYTLINAHHGDEIKPRHNVFLRFYRNKACDSCDKDGMTQPRDVACLCFFFFFFCQGCVCVCELARAASTPPPHTLGVTWWDSAAAAATSRDGKIQDFSVGRKKIYSASAEQRIKR